MAFFFLMAVYGIVVLVLETTFFSNLPTEMLRFDFMIVAVAALCFYRGWRKAIPVIVFLGCITDISSSGPFGLSIMSYLVIYGLIRLIIAKISFQAGIQLLLWVVIISLTDKFVSSLFLLGSTGKMVFPNVIMQSAPAQALLDAALAFIMIPFIRNYWNLSWERITRPKKLVLK